jgi:ribosome recycling factor
MASAMAGIEALKGTHQQLKAKMESTVEDFRGLRTASVGLNPMTDGKVIRVPVPPMTEERRKDVVKQLNKTLEDHKTAIRNIRRDGNEQIKKAAKDKLISADDEKRASEEVQQLTDAEIKRVEDLFKAKEKEILTV